jgi:hypothetical protein
MALLFRTCVRYIPDVVMVQRPDGSLVDEPPERCGITTHGVACDSTSLRPSWGRCPQREREPYCGQMTRLWICERGHVQADADHEHREVPPERPRWNCGYEDRPS